MLNRSRSVLLGSVLALIVAPALAHAQETTVPLQLNQRLADAIHFGPQSDVLLFTNSASEADQTQAQPRAQNPRHEGIGIGIKGGFLFSSLHDAMNTNADFTNRTGGMIGIFFGGNRPGTVGVMGELMYAKKGASDSHGDTLDLHYIEIPVLVRVNAGSNSLNGILGYFLVGPVFDIKLKAALNGVDVGSDYQSFDIGVIVGGGIEITRFIVEGRYNWGLRNIAGSDLATYTNIKTRSFALLFGLRFN